MCLIEHYKAKELFIHFRIQSICILFKTPEQLLKVEDGVLSTKVGTIKRSNDIDEDEKIYKHF